jgi:hypothetical protein
MGLKFSPQAKEEKSLGIQANVGRNQRDRIKMTKREETGAPETAPFQSRHRGGPSVPGVSTMRGQRRVPDGVPRHGERGRERRRWQPASGEGDAKKGNRGGVHRKGKSPSPASEEEREGDAASSPTIKPATVPLGPQCVKSYHLCLNCSYDGPLLLQRS